MPTLQSSAVSPLSVLVVCIAGFAFSAQPAFAADDPKCLARFNAERVRIEMEMAAEAPKASDQQAAQRWSAKLHALMEAAGREAEACNRRSKPPLTQQERSNIDACLARVSQQYEAGDRQFKGRTLTMAEQTAQRALQQKTIDDRAACMKAHQR